MSEYKEMGKPITKPIATGGAKAQPYIGGLQPGGVCETKKTGIIPK